jgi:Meiotically Up-regulated Gene 113 (MUG113) protein/HNH endonuclease
MKREQILAEIRRLAGESGRKPPGQDRFTTETGIRKADWYGRHWVRWGDALRAAGFEPNRFASATPDEELLGELAHFTWELGHFPVEAGLLMKARSDPTFPDHPTLHTRLGNKAKRAAKLRAFCLEKGIDQVAVLCPPADADDEAEDDATENSAAELGSVYLLKFGRFHKIGRSNAVGRRERELAIQLPEKVRVVHVIKTDDPAGIEAYWHRRFAERRKNGEWFELSVADVVVFRRRKFM